MNMRACRPCLALLGIAMLLVSCQPAQDPLPSTAPRSEQSILISSTHRKVSQEQAAINAGLLEGQDSASRPHDVSSKYGEDASPPAAAESGADAGSKHAADVPEESSAAESSAATAVPEAEGLTNHKSEFAAYAYDTGRVREAIQNQAALEEGKRIAFLTFDDGIDPDSTPLLLDILKDLGAPATFFMLGQSLHAENRPILERMLNEGHALGLHSYNHSYKQLYPEGVGDAAAVLDHALRSQAALEETLDGAYSSGVWRYPGGHMTWQGLEAADEVLAGIGVQWIDWNALNEDANMNKPGSVEGQVEVVIDGWKRYHGESDTMVVLMHDGGAYQLTRDSLPAIVRRLRELDFSFGILK